MSRPSDDSREEEEDEDEDGEDDGEEEDEEEEEEEEDDEDEDEDDEDRSSSCSSCQEKKRNIGKHKSRKELGLSCMLNTEVGAVLAVLRRTNEASADDIGDSATLHSLKSLRALIFNPLQEWRMVDPSVYLGPFLDVVQCDDISAPATGVALSAVLKILRLNIFDEGTPGAKDAVLSVVQGVTNCRMERSDPATEEAILMRVLHVLTWLVKARAAVLLTDHAVCTVVNTCFQIVQQSSVRGDLLQRGARYAMHELIQAIFSRLARPHHHGDSNSSSGSDTDGGGTNPNLVGVGVRGFGVGCAVDIFHFLCSLLNAVSVVETEGSTSQISDEDVQLFALVLINSAIEMAGDSIGKHPKLLKLIQDDLFHHLIHYGMCSSPFVLSMICSTVLNIYNSLRLSTRLQLEAFFTLVLCRTATIKGASIQLQEVAVEGIINFCRQPMFAIETYINFDCDPIFPNVFEEIGKLLCRHAFPAGTGSPSFTSLQVQAFEGLVYTIHAIAENIDKDRQQHHPSSPSGSYQVKIPEESSRPLWEDKTRDQAGDAGEWVKLVRLRKAQKRKMVIAGNHFNRDVKKGLEYLKISHLVSDPADPRSLAFFFRYTPKLDKNRIGDFLGEPDELNIRVLKEFTNTFDFSGMILDNALRAYLETFRLPGESQKIDRILEPFSEKFYESKSSSEIFVTKDAVFILCYSLIMLNTDQHNPQVKKKMTEEEFIRNNRGINGGKDLPREYLSELFQSISNNAITIFGSSGSPSQMNPSWWTELMNRTKVMQPYITSDYHRLLGRDMLAVIAGPTVAALCATFEHADDEDILHECINGLFTVSRIAQYGLADTLDEILASFCRFTTLLNPYVTADETLFVFSNEVKPRMAILAVFTLANSFESSIRGGWRNIVDCLLKLKRLKLLPQSVVEVDPNATHATTATTSSHHSRIPSESGIILPNPDPKLGSQGQASDLMTQFSHFMSGDCMEESLTLGGGEFKQNLKIIQQCRIGNIFANSSSLPEEPLLNLGRSLIFAAAGKGQKFSTAVEEEDTVAFCWDLVTTIALSNTHRFIVFWPSYHDYFLAVTQFPLFSSTPFAEKAIVGLFKVCLKLLASPQPDKQAEELIFKSINLMWKLEKEVLDTCCEFIAETVGKILNEYPQNLQSHLGWKTVLHLLSITGRHPETYEQAAEILIKLMSDHTCVSKTNYTICMECAFSFVALKNSPLDTNLKILDLMADSVNLLIEWYRNAYSDAGSNFSTVSAGSYSSVEDLRGFGFSNFIVNLFVKLGESLRKTSLARREEIRNHAITCLQRSFILSNELGLTSMHCINCFNFVIFAMVDDLHEKMLEYSRRENSEREMRSMEGTLKMAMELLTDVFLQFLQPLSESPGFRSFWLGALRRMDTCMKTDLGGYGDSTLQALVPEWLRKLLTRMKEKEILVQREGDDLWEITHIQIQWIAPSLKEELFPEEEL